MLPSEIHVVAKMTSLRAVDGDTSYHSRESFSFNSILIFGPFSGAFSGAFSGPFLLFTLSSWDICPFSKFLFRAIFGAVFGPFLMLLNCAPARPVRVLGEVGLVGDVGVGLAGDGEERRRPVRPVLRHHRGVLA